MALWTVRGSCHRVAERCGPPAPLLITIWLGYEDSRLSPFYDSRPLLEFEQHLRHLRTHDPGSSGLEDCKDCLDLSTTSQYQVAQGTFLSISGHNGDTRNMVLTSRAPSNLAGKRKYAEKSGPSGRGIEDETMRVAVIDLWQALIRWACGRNGNENPGDFDELDELDMLPGCGLPNARQFGTEIFNDNLHLGPKVFITYRIEFYCLRANLYNRPMKF